MKYLTPRFMAVLWMVGFGGSFVIQTVFQTWFAENSYWGINHGWQNEIAIWNLGVLIMLVGVLRSKSGIEAYILPGLAVLSLCFGINHTVALASSPTSFSNWAGSLTNWFAVVLYAIHLMSSRKASEMASSNQPLQPTRKARG